MNDFNLPAHIVRFVNNYYKHARGCYDKFNHGFIEDAHVDKVPGKYADGEQTDIYSCKSLNRHADIDHFGDRYIKHIYANETNNILMTNMLIGPLTNQRRACRQRF